jgi:ATP-dependent Clp protease protease subunit
MTPVIFETTAQGERGYDIYSWLLQKNIIYLSGEVTRDSADIICAQIMAKSLESVDHVKLYINSPGGSVSGLFSIIDTIRCTDVNVHTYCVGVAASAAAVLLTCGKKGYRHILPSASIMFHDISGWAGGTSKDMKSDYEFLLHQRNLLKNILMDTTSQYDENVIETLLDRDKWLTPQEAINLGAADKIVSKINV